MNSINDARSSLGEQEANLAVGYIATSENTDQLIRSTIRAKLHGYNPLITYAGGERPASVTLAEEIGATVIEPESTEESPELLRQFLVGAAKASSHSGLVLAPLDCSKIDYRRSQEALESDELFAAEAVTLDAAHAEQSPSVLVAIPAYNEAETIADVVTEATAYADSVVVIDDGSDDGTAHRARDAGADIVEHGSNTGYGAALKTAFVEAQNREAEVLVILDGDGQHDPSDIPILAERLRESDSDLVIGSRFVADGDSNLPLYRRLGLIVINVLTNLTMGRLRNGVRIRDTQSGFRAYNQEVVGSLLADEMVSSDMGASTDILRHVLDNGFDVAEVGTTVSYTVDNANSHNPLKHGITLVANILNIVERRHPIIAFGIPGFLTILFGLIVGYQSVVSYVSTNTLPTAFALTGVVLILVGILSCFTAIILHSLTVHFTTEIR